MGVFHHPAKALQHDPDISSVRCHARARELHLTIFSECQLVMCQALTRRMPLVTIRAQDLTFRNFQSDAGGRDAKVDHVADVGRLCGRVEMIELQDDGTADTTLHARMLGQKLGDECTIRVTLEGVIPLITLQICAFIVHVVLLRNEPAALAAACVAFSRTRVLEWEIVDWVRDSASSAQPIDNVLTHDKL